MEIGAAEAALRDKLSQAGVDMTKPDFLTTWRLFKAFAMVPVDSRSDGLLFQSGVYRFSGSERFIVDFLRQFEVTYEDGEHDHYEQLHCEFLYPPSPGLRELGSTTIWCFQSEGDSFADWCADVEARTEFDRAATLQPHEARVFQEAV